jgi:hypothetical protein
MSASISLRYTLSSRNPLAKTPQTIVDQKAPFKPKESGHFESSPAPLPHDQLKPRVPTFAVISSPGRTQHQLAALLLAGLENEVERRLGRAAEAGETRFGEDMPQPAFAGLRAQTKPDFL